MSKQALIVGAGLGALATALRLSKRGYKLTIIEKNAQAGGRLNQLKDKGFTFDTGPSFFSMSYEFEELAKDAGFQLPYEIIALDPLYTVHFSEQQESFTIYKDLHKLAQQFKDIEPDFEKHIRAYLKEGQRLFEGTVDIVVRQNFNSIIHYLFTLLKAPPQHLPKLLRSFWQQVERYFTSRQAREIVSLVAFFLGRTPFDTSAVYTLLSYTEFIHDGYYNVRGGMYRIVEGLVNELKQRGVDFYYNIEIIDYQKRNGKLAAFIDQNGQSWSADLMVVNADAAVFRGQIFKRPKYSRQRLDKLNWTMGPLTIYLGINRKLPDVAHHNYYVGGRFKEYARKVYRQSDIIETPYYYVNVLSHSNPECAPQGCESLFFVCPVPDLRFKTDWSDQDEIVRRIIGDFSQRTGINISAHIVSQTVYTPKDWEEQYNLHRGSGLGLAHDLLQIGAFRPANVDEVFKNVFYVGASTLPGTGLPMVIISSKLVVERIEQYATLSSVKS